MSSHKRSISKTTGLTKLALIAGLLHALIAPAHAETEEQILQRLNQMVIAEQYDEAWLYSNEHVMEMGGDPDFDYLMGMAALNTESYQEAVFAFERAVIVKPKWVQARYQLARSYIQVDNLAASKTELQRLKTEVTDQDFIDRIDSYIQQVDEAIVNKKRIFTQQLSFTVGFDDNINSGTDALSVFVEQLGTDIPLSPDSRAIEDTSYNTYYIASYTEPFTQSRLVTAQVGIFRTDYQDTPQFERTMGDITLKLQDEWDDFTWQVGGFFRPMELDGTHYRDQWGFATTWGLPLDANWTIGWQLGFGETDYKLDDGLDVKDVFGTVSATYRSGLWTHAFSANHTDIHAKQAATKYHSNYYFKLVYQNAYVLTPSQQLGFNVTYQKHNYDEIHPIVQAVRDEDLLMAGVNWRWMYNEWLMLTAGYQYTDKQSNGELFSYERNVFNLGFTVQF